MVSPHAPSQLQFVVAFILISTLTAPSYGQEEAQPRLSLERIIAAITANYARLETVQLTVESTSIDPGVTEETVTTIDLPNGGKATFSRQPRTVRLSRIVLRGKDLRSDSIDQEHWHIWSFHKGVWTQYAPETQMAWQRRPDQMPGMFPIDPREAGSNEIRTGLLQRLSGDTLIEAERRKTADGQPLVRLLMERRIGEAHSQRYRCDFDPGRNYLPVAVAYLHDDGSINVAIEITYRETPVDSTWFPQKTTIRIFGNQGVQNPEAEGWTGMMTMATKGEVMFNASIPDEAFQIDLAEGTRVSDSVNRSIYRVGDDLDADTSGLTKAGELAPAFELKVDDKTIRSEDLKGKVVLLVFFATWCGPCMAELPRIEAELWQKFKSKGLVVMAVGREHSQEELRTFHEDGKFTFALAADPERKVFSKFATKSIPRSYLIRADGTIAYQSMGYSTPKFARLVAAVEKALADRESSK